MSKPIKAINKRTIGAALQCLREAQGEYLGWVAKEIGSTAKSVSNFELTGMGLDHLIDKLPGLFFLDDLEEMIAEARKLTSFQTWEMSNLSVSDGDKASSRGPIKARAIKKINKVQLLKERHAENSKEIISFGQDDLVVATTAYIDSKADEVILRDRNAALEKLAIFFESKNENTKFTLTELKKRIAQADKTASTNITERLVAGALKYAVEKLYTHAGIITQSKKTERGQDRS